MTPTLTSPKPSLSTGMYQDQPHQVTVQEEGFEYQGQHYPTLSRIARAITGTPWNGFLFFGLQTRGKEQAR